MKESTRKIIRLHGWRLDRAIHNYLYYQFYVKRRVMIGCHGPIPKGLPVHWQALRA